MPQNPRAIRIIDGAPRLDHSATEPGQPTDGVRVRVTSASICGSDLHMLSLGLLEGRVPGHEFAGLTPDGTPVAIEPIVSCGSCALCERGDRHHCDAGTTLIGIGVDGGMAEEIVVPASTLVELPSGVGLDVACLVEPLAVALHAVRRARVTGADRVLVIGAGPIGLSAVAVLHAQGVRADLVARYEHQQAAGVALGGSLAAAETLGGGYDVVLDAVGSSATVRQAVGSLRPMGRLAMLAVFWEPVAIDMGLLMREVDLIPAMMYRGLGPDRDFVGAAQILSDTPSIADAMITHRFPLDGAVEGFAAANDRSAGAIKVVFEP